jgi:lipoprotein signal peptidase
VLSAFAGVLAIDISTKIWAAAVLTEPVRITDWLYLMLHRNAGLFLGTVPVSVEYWIGMCAAACWFGWRALRSSSAPLSVCLAVVLAGVAGNAIGQSQGAVVDFLGVGPIADDTWLVMNVADLALVGGGLALGACLVRERVCRVPLSR